MQVTTKPAKKGRSICSDCNGELILQESKQYITPRVGDPYSYILEFSQCSGCGADFVLQESIIKNEARSKQARKEATTAYKMNKWLNNK